MRRSLLLAALLLGLPSAAAAQAVQGTFVDQRSGEPVSGARILLRDAHGQVVASASTAPSGRFFLRAPAAGSYTLVAERVGYERTLSSPLTLPADQTVQFELAATPERVMLEGIVVEAGARCTVRPAEGLQTAAVWEEARKALESARSTAEERLYLYGVQLFSRQLDPASRTVLSDSARSARGVGSHPFVSVPVERLAANGYVEEDGDALLFHAPDAAALLSDAFLDHHCLRLTAPPAGEEEWIGLAFEPVRGRRVPDIRGTLWLDRATAELRRLEFGYTGLRSRKAAEDAGGEVEFLRMPNGRWIVSRWRIRMPVLAAERGHAGGVAMPHLAGARSGALREWKVVGLAEQGGEVTSITTRSGAPVELRPRAMLAGEVFDSTRAAPLAGARVRLEGTAYAAETDSLGRFVLRDLPGGTYSLSFGAAHLDSLGYAPPSVRVTLKEGSTARYELAVPSLTHVLAAACEEGGEGGVLVGMVSREGASEPLAGARVALSWGEGTPREARTDRQGAYRFCAVPAAVPLAVSVEAPGAMLSVSELRLAATAPVRQDFVVPAPAASPRPGVDRAGVEVAGRVVTADTRAPVVGAVVRLGSDGEARTTDASGRFTLRGMKAGSYTATVTHPAHGTRSVQVALGGDLAELELRLPRGDGPGALLAVVSTAVELEGIRVAGRSLSRRLESAGFYERQKRGIGSFLTEEEIHRVPGRPLSDLLRTVAGLRIVNHFPSDGGGNFQRNPEKRLVARREMTNSAPACYLSIYLDGVMLSSGMDMHSGNDIDKVVPRTRFKGIEIYRSPAQMPAQYHDTFRSPCGVLLLWSDTGET